MTSDLETLGRALAVVARDAGGEWQGFTGELIAELDHPGPDVEDWDDVPSIAELDAVLHEHLFEFEDEVVLGEADRSRLWVRRSYGHETRPLLPDEPHGPWIEAGPIVEFWTLALRCTRCWEPLSAEWQWTCRCYWDSFELPGAPTERDMERLHARDHPGQWFEKPRRHLTAEQGATGYVYDSLGVRCPSWRQCWHCQEAYARRLRQARQRHLGIATDTERIFARITAGASTHEYEASPT